MSIDRRVLFPLEGIGSSMLFSLNFQNLIRAGKVLKKHGGMLRTTNAMQLGIHPRTLGAPGRRRKSFPLGGGSIALQRHPPSRIPIG